MIVRSFALLALMSALFAVTGCGGGQQLAEVEGTVKLKGTALDKIQVEFWPEGDGQRSMGTTDAQGRFTLVTDDGKQGAVVGSHKVVLKDIGVLGDQFLGRAGESVDLTKGRKPRISNAYSEPQKTSIKKEVTAGKSVIDIDLTTP